LAPWRNQIKTLSHYWKIYGGIYSLFKSPYLHLAIALSAVLAYSSYGEIKAAGLAVSVIPSLLGFTVGALAIVLAFSSAKIFTTLAEEGDPKSFFMTLTAALVHFIVVQVSALVVGIVTQIVGSDLLELLTLFFLFYAIFTALAAGVQLFNTAIIYNASSSITDEQVSCEADISRGEPDQS
jgi:hypothetical protein